MPQSLTPLTAQRLAYIRFIYQEGIEQSRQPSVLSARALTSFHDAVENFLGLVVEQLEVDVRKAPDFLGYWEVIKPKLELPSKAAMKRLNDWRVALKHNGSFPSEHQIEQSRTVVADFFTTVTPKVFGVDFDSVEMVDLITQDETARLVREAQTHADVGDYVAAMAGLSLAFNALRKHYAGEYTEFSWAQKPFSFGPSLSHTDEPRADNGDHHVRRLHKLSVIATEVREAMQVLSLGLDFPSYTRFKTITPQVHGYYSGPDRYVVTNWLASLTADDYEWAKLFVVESALRAARADEVRALLEAQAEADPHWQQYPEREWTGPAAGA
ncbi:hypothetical protein AB0420_35960 [Streptomyces caelestis]|uniref:Uncharacterized protein n=1 Tax=Streptomyces heliomycini TaxID=284032 RepID=A0ABV5L5H5_9ACTN|nr:hypothetical protein [Streptomyces sp. XY152]KOV35654.1 hypothetical protein ADK58_02740 [Streptomyces sp. XY152]